MLREDAVAIVNQEFVPLFAPDGLTQLLQRPGGTRMRCDVAMDQAATVMLDHHEHVQQSKRCGDGDEEIAGNESPGRASVERSTSASRLSADLSDAGAGTC